MKEGGGMPKENNGNILFNRSFEIVNPRNENNPKTGQKIAIKQTKLKRIFLKVCLFIPSCS